jgi:hypothetical protein
MSFENRFLDLAFGFMLGVLSCVYSKNIISDKYIKIIAILTLCIIVLNSDFLIESIIIFLLLIVCIQIILSNFL